MKKALLPAVLVLGAFAGCGSSQYSDLAMQMTGGGIAAKQAQDFDPTKNVSNLRDEIPLSMSRQNMVSMALFTCNPTRATAEEMKQALPAFQKQMRQVKAKQRQYNDIKTRLQEGRLTRSDLEGQSPEVKRLGQDWNEFIDAELGYLQEMESTVTMPVELSTTNQATLKAAIKLRENLNSKNSRVYLPLCKKSAAVFRSAAKEARRDSSGYDAAVSRVESAREALSKSFGQNTETKDISDQMQKLYQESN